MNTTRLTSQGAAGLASDRVERRLTAIMAADVAGYSRLMGTDEEETLAQLKMHQRELVDPKIAEHRGRVVKTTGDGLLAEFASVVDAVRCAVDIQGGMAKRNADVPPDRRIEFRVGINVGDIIIDEDDIFGDGVNVAARLEALAQPGGICVSRTVRDQVRDKLALAFEDLGEQPVKNIARPVRAYRVVTDAGVGPTVSAAPGRRRQVPRWVIAAGVAGLVLGASGAAAFWRLYLPHPAPSAAGAPATPPALPDKPSIAVLPFANLSGDPAQDYLADGLTDNIVDALAQNPGLFVIARNATLDYRGKAVAPQAAAKDLGVRYVLEGSVQKSGDHIRVTAQLIDAVNDSHLLSQKYDRNLTNLFALEDDLSLQIAGALDVQLRGGTLVRGSAHGTHNLEAWENLVKASQVYFRFNPADVSAAQKLAQRAVDLDPNYITAWQVLAFTYFDQADLGWAQDRIAALDHARQLNDKVLQLDPESEGPYMLRARLELQPDLPEYDPEAALADARKSVALGPNEDPSRWTLGLVLFQLGRFDEAAAEFATALRLNPHPYIWESGLHAVALSATGHHKEAIAEIEAATAAQPKNPFGLFFRGQIEKFAGNYANAAGWFERAREADPASSQNALLLAEVYDRLGRVDEAISLLENGPAQWRSVPAIRFWRGLSYALAGRKEQAAGEFTAFRALAPKWTLSTARRFWGRYFTPQFADRLAALSREYGIPEK
jgi:class 3 adenylate cyclase/TolB-like protein/Tfp pilus assembly protein PilF